MPEAVDCDYDRDPELAHPAAVRDYLIGKGADPDLARSAAGAADVPLAVTKRGVLAFVRRR